ncbi:MAG: hypothetical protein IPJ94_19695 [Chloroflexi bacterium]|nr:hypothetical protein [Chloroflexota bacterium]
MTWLCSGAGLGASHTGRLEEPVLRHYHQHLRQHGITDYTWDQLWVDYR